MRKTMTYKEWLDWQRSSMGRFQKFLEYMTGGPPPNWYAHYLQYVLRCISKAEDLESTKESARIALGDKNA